MLYVAERRKVTGRGDEVFGACVVMPVFGAFGEEERDQARRWRDRRRRWRLAGSRACSSRASTVVVMITSGEFSRASGLFLFNCVDCDAGYPRPRTAGWAWGVHR